MTLTTDVPRPVLRYHGGKWKLAPWIVEHFGAHTFYTEAYGGAASVLLRKPRAIGEVYNDLNDELVNLFTVLREERLATQLQQQLELTGYARKEYERARQPSSDPVESARRLIVRSFMGFGSAGFNADHNTGFRSTIKRGVSARQVQRGPAYEWATYPEIIMPLMQRMKGVVIEERRPNTCWPSTTAAKPCTTWTRPMS